MNKPNIPFFALLIGYAGALTNVLTEAKSIIGAFAALASLVASLYAIVISHQRLKAMSQNPFAAKPGTASRRPLRRGQSGSDRSSRAKKVRKIIARCSLFIALVALTGCATSGSGNSPLGSIAAMPSRILDAATTLLTGTTTNIVQQAVITATDVVTLDPLTHVSLTNTTYATNFTLVTNITAVPKSVVVKTIDTAQTAGGFLPPPYGEAAAAGLGIISALLAAAVKRRNALLKTVIHGVESSGSKEAKSEISDRAMENGVFSDLHTLVKKLTTQSRASGPTGPSSPVNLHPSSLN